MLISPSIGVPELLVIINMKCQGAKPEGHNPNANHCEKPQTPHFWVIHICAKQNQQTRCNWFLFHSCTRITGRHIDIVLPERLLHYYHRPIILHFTYEHAHSVSHRPVALSKRPQPPLSKIELTGKGSFYYTVDILLLLAWGRKGAAKMNTKCSREIKSSETRSKQGQKTDQCEVRSEMRSSGCYYRRWQSLCLITPYEDVEV
jgi:hypothetical protein